MMKKIAVLCTCLVLYMLSFMYAFSQQSPDYSVMPLKGIKQMSVLVETLSDDAVNIGLSRTEIQTSVELMLRREGINLDFDYTMPSLYVNISVVGPVYHISVSLKDWVNLHRDPAILCRAATWEKGSTGAHGKDSEFIVDNLKKHIESFLNDYYRANPK